MLTLLIPAAFICIIIVAILFALGEAFKESLSD